MHATLPKRSEVHPGTDLRLLGSTNPVHCVLVLQIMYCSCHVVCLGRSASRSKYRAICACFGTRTQWSVVVFKNHSATPPPILLEQTTEARRAPPKFWDCSPTPPPPPHTSQGLAGQFAVGKNQGRGKNREWKLMVSMSENLCYFTKSNLDFQRIVII